MPLRYRGSTWRTRRNAPIHKGGYGKWKSITYVEVRDGPSWIDGTSNHLEKLVGGDSVAHACNKECREWRYDRTRDDGDNVRPNGQRRLAMKHSDKTYIAPRKTSGMHH